MQKMRILFVDDDRPVLEALRRSLFRQAEAWDMTFFTDPAAAAAAFAEAPFDVVVTDLQMPGMNGLELAQVVKMHDPAAQIIVLTGTADLVQAIDAINEAGAFRFYTKPCPTGRIAEGISAALSERERRAGGAAAIGEAALNRLPVGVIVVDAATQVIFMNPPGARIVAAGDGLRLDRQRVLRADGLDDTAALHHAVAVLSRSQVSLAAQVLVI
ncbi:MAG: response regulator, partial [Parvibaculum sp.]